MQDSRPGLVKKVAMALQVFRHGYPTKSAPYMWPDYSTGRPSWQIIDYQSYVAEGFNLNTLVYDAIMYKVKAMTAAPLRAYKGEQDSPEALPPEAEVSKLITRPNEHQSWEEFHAQNIVYKNVSGNYYVFFDRPNRGAFPRAMYSLRPDRVYIIPNKKKRMGLMGYMYVPEGKTWQQGTPILPEYLMHVKFPNPSDPYEGMGYGLSPMSPLARSADVDNQITRYLKMFFDKGAMQSGAVSFDVPLTPDTIANLREQFAETYGGTDNWMKPVVFDRGGEYKRMSLTFDEMGFQGLDERNESRILGPFGVPPVLVGSRIGLENSPWSNIEEARRIFWEDTMLPESRLDEVEYDHFLGGNGVFLRFDTSDVPALRKDIKGQVAAAYNLWQMGVPRDSALSTVGLDVEQIEGGEISWVPTSMVPVAKALAPPEEPIEEVIVEPEPSKHKDRLWTKQDIISQVWERQFRDTARERFEVDKRKLLSLMKSRQKEAKAAKATIDWQAIYQDWMEYLDGAGAAWRSAFIPLMKGLILDQGVALNVEFGMVFDVANLFAQSWFDTYTLTFAEDVVTVTGAALDSMLKTAMAEGWSIPVMQKRLELLFKEWMEGGLAPEEFAWFEERMPSYRTEMIARTETIRASNKGADALYQAWGAEWKEWVAAEDERTCPWCNALDGERFRTRAVVKMDGVEFTKGAVWNLEIQDPETKEWKTHTIKFDYETVTGPPLHVQCRCSLVPWKESWAEPQPGEAA